MPRIKVKIEKANKSPKFSFKGWDVWKWIKGRKKTFITVIAGILSYWITSDATTSIVAGGLVEAVFAIIDYYMKEKN